MKKFTKIAAVAMTGLISAATCASLTACGNKVPEGFTAVGYICCGLTNSNKSVFQNMVDTYNSTQGQTDKVYVDATYSLNTEYGQYSSELNRSTSYSVATVRDSQIKGLATVTAKNGFVNIDEVASPELKAALAKMPAELVNRFRINSTQDADGQYLAGEGANLLGVPLGSQPHVLYYNKKIFGDQGINIISVAEDKLAAYNTANSGKLAPHGYAEYKENPLPNASPALQKSKNERNEDVYKVFNNRIAMNWSQQRLLARYFQTKGGYEYGYMNEWWFDYVWSIGGDNMVWNDTNKSYEFALADKSPNYLATEAVTVNGRSYSKGDVLLHEDALKVTEADKSKLYELPSNYEAFLEFNRMGVPTSKTVDTGYNGYGVAPNTIENRTKWFVSGTNCPMLVEQYELGLQSFQNTAVKNNWDIAPTVQYRLYDNDGVYYNGAKSFANEYLMVIGEKYDLNGDGTVGTDEVYTGAVKTVNGTPIVGENGAASVGYSLSIPTKAPSGTQEAALKFITWVATEGQKFIGDTNTYIPADLEYALSDEFCNSSNRISNVYAASLINSHADIGDYTYFNSRIWIDNWSGMLNGEVRRGEKTIQQFLDAKLAGANSDLGTMNIRIKGR
ncbi:MAG: hypothetical protein NC311_11780 [Muribaculaceae bacterium]|nr:hypothetical protein [Muribaculaceae bacterium]